MVFDISFLMGVDVAECCTEASCDTARLPMLLRFAEAHTPRPRHC